MPMCPGHRNAHTCGSTLFHCSKCDNSGCSNTGCTNQAFSGCKCCSCGSSSSKGSLWSILLFVGLLFCSVSAYAGDDKPLPPEAETVVEKHDAVVAAAKKAYEAAVAKADSDASKDLQKVLAATTKAGKLDAALAVKAKIDSYALKVDTGKLVIIVAKYGIQGNYIDVTKFVVAKIKDGVLKFTNDEDGAAGLDDPAPGATKSFVITYTLGGTQKTETFSKHAVINLGG